MTPPNDVPLALRRVWNAAEAFAERDSSDWGRACRDAWRASTDASEAERAMIRTYGLVIRRGPATLGEHHLGDGLGREVLAELSAKQRGGS